MRTWINPLIRKLKMSLNIKKMSVGVKLNLSFTLVIIVMLTVMGYYYFRNMSNTSIDNVRESSFELMRQTAKNLDIVYSDIDKTAIGISRDQEITTRLTRYNHLDEPAKIESSNSIHTIMRGYINSNLEFADMYIYNDNAIFYSGSGVGTNFRSSYPVLKFKENNKKTLWLDTYVSDHGSTKAISSKVVTLMKTMYEPSGLKSVGTLMVNLPEKHLYEILQDVEVGYEGQVLILGKQGNIVMNPKNLEKNSLVIKDSYVKTVSQNENGAFTDKINGKESLIAFYTVERTGWKVVSIIPTANITEGINKTGIKIIILLVICLIVGSVISGVISAHTSKLLERLVIERTNQLKETLETLKNTQDQLIESEKMASLGNLVAGVAHEINTPLGVSVTAASHLDYKTKEFVDQVNNNTLKRSDLDKFVELTKETMGIMMRNLERASDLIRSFKQVAVDQTTEEKRTFNFKQYIDEVLISLRPAIKKNKINIDVYCEENLEIKTYPGAFAQVITNLVMNSMLHAYKHGDEGQINFRIEKKGNHCSFKYSDDGKGIEKEVIKKIFEPFYTTKRGQGGTGLGMYIVYNIVAQKLGGTIKCESEVGKGTTFIIEFPID